jgi:hypothetical protein
MAVSLLHAVYHPGLAYTTCGVVQASASTGKPSGKDAQPQPLCASISSHVHAVLPVKAAHLVFSAIFREWRLLPVPFARLILVE